MGKGTKSRPVASEQDRYQVLESQFVAKLLKYQVRQRQLIQSEEYKALRKKRDRAGIRELMSVLIHPRKEFTPRFQKLAAERKDTKNEAAPLLWLVKNSRDPKIIFEASMAVIERHPKGNATLHLVEGWTDFFPLREKRDLVFDAIVRHSKNENAVAEAMWVKAYLSRQKDQQDVAKATILKKFPQSTPALRYRGEAFKKARLQVDMKAPEVEGVDIDGTAFKLSDYRGKVVLLDFWGDW